MRHRRTLAFVCMSAALVSRAGAQEQHSHHGASEALGSVHFPVACETGVQATFTRAVALLHSFGYEEARKSFAKVGEQDPSCGGTCLRHAELQRQIMLDNGDAATPMWATEVGWLMDSSNDVGPYFNWMKVSPQQQADYLVGAMQYAQANWPWMQRLFVFNLDHSTAMWCGGPCYPPSTSVHWFSVLNPDRSPRPAGSCRRASSR